MIDDLKKYIDSQIKKKLRVNGGSYEKAGLPVVNLNGKKELDYSAWLDRLVSITIDGYIPDSIQQVELLEFLCFELLYKQSIKSLVDSEHLAINEALAKLGVNDESTQLILGKISKFSANKIDYFLLFREEIEAEEETLNAVHKRIDAISDDSRFGTIISHAAKMTHPSCKYPRVSASSNPSNDGYVRTGNNDVEFDLHIDATKLKVYKFLALKAQGTSILDLVRGNDAVRLSSIFSVSESRAAAWIKSFHICVFDQDTKTHPAIRQINFPVDDGYHLLSVLQPSGLVFLLKQRIDAINDRSAVTYSGKKAKKENKYFSRGYAFVPGLTVTQHGGAHPKNISALNNKYQGYYLLSSEPPKLAKRDIHFPTVDFFTQSLSHYQCKDLYYLLHDLFLGHKNDWNVRRERDEYYQAIIDRIIEKMWVVRGVSEEQFNPDATQLNKTQKTWLCAANEKERDMADDWLDELCADIARFIFNGYEKSLGKKAFMFSDAEFKHIHKQVVKNKEALR